MIVIADNDRSAHRAAVEQEKMVAIEQAKQIAAEHGIEERIAVANSMFLERKIIEERQVSYQKGNSQKVMLDNFLSKCAMCR